MFGPSTNLSIIKDIFKNQFSHLLLTDLYPPIYDLHLPPQDRYPNYIRTYVDRDARYIKNISDLIIFERFLGLLAGRNGQELNLSSLAVETGIDNNAAEVNSSCQ